MLKLFLIMAIVITIATFLFGFILPKELIQSGDGYIDRWHKFYTQQSSADLVLLGSSRIHRHCDTKILSGMTHFKAEVVATAGAQFHFYEKLFEDYLKRNPNPKLLIVGIDLTGLGNSNYVPNPEYFFPFIQPSDAVASFAEFNYIKRFKPLGYFYYKEIYYEKIVNPENAPHFAGFSPRDESWDNTQEPFIGKFASGFNLELSDQTIDHIFNFMQEQQKKGVNCMAIIAPEYYPVWSIENNRNLAIQKLFNTANYLKIRLINFSDSSYKICFNQRYFYNSQHLNKNGAEIFSKDLADSINKYYP